ncbi:helix-turn-helix domain-containing protein [Lentibacillus jeotgali]|uniref:helix-turn-helix domain-containing protein n=1 Tax=Lentibacillus jeotgali TaxID=558169 RepID=UPI000262886D|nr:helix-turn-helix transcriptional regulator [Lentibacillus jeotgali]
MKAGIELKALRKRKGYTQENVATELHVSNSFASHLENDRREMTKELAITSASAFNEAQYGFEIARKTAMDYIAPLTTTGDAIEWHRLALEQVFINKSKKAIERFNEFSFVQPPEFADNDELDQIKERAEELLDLQMIINSFLACLEQEYGISIRECMKSRLSYWKSEEWI